MVVHELRRNLLKSVTLAVEAIETAKAGASGATGAFLDRSLVAMSELMARLLTEDVDGDAAA